MCVDRQQLGQPRVSYKGTVLSGKGERNTGSHSDIDESQNNDAV